MNQQRDDEFGTPDGHAGEMLSAAVDDELSADEHRWLEAHLLACDGCRTEQDELEAASQLISGLGSMDSTPVVDGFVSRHRSAIRTGLGFVGVASIMLGALAFTSAVATPTVVPDIENFVLAHQQPRGSTMDEMTPVTAIGSPYQAPVAFGLEQRFERDSLTDGHDVAAMTYRVNSASVSIFQQAGRVDWSALPETHSIVGSRRVWLRRGSPTVVVVQSGQLAVTVVADSELDALAAVEELPPGHRKGAWNRVHDAAQRVTEVFGLEG